MNPFELFAQSAKRYPQRVALKDDGESLTYEEVLTRVELLAASLQSQGMHDGSRIAILAPNCNLALVGALAVFRLGAVWVPLNVRNSTQDNIGYMKRCNVDALLWDSETWDEAYAISAGLSESVRLTALDSREDSRALHELSSAPDQVCAMLSTGGTTGSPKAVIWTNRVFQTMVCSFWIHLPDQTPGVYLAATPLTHAAGVIAFCLLARGATVLIHRGVNPPLLLAAIEKERVTHLFLPPTAIYSLLLHPEVASGDYSSLRYFIYSAAPMAPQKIREAVDVFGPVMVQLYGQAEVPLMATVLTPAEHAECLAGVGPERLSSCGRSTLLVELEILSPNGHIVPDGERGEIAIRSDLVMAGYYAHPAESEEVSRFGWHHTGDVGYRDSEGYVYVVDRIKDMIITGGFNVFSSEVEQVVLSHPAVQDCAVVGQPDEKWGEAVTAVLQLKPGAELDINEIRAMCRERLGGVMAPKHYYVWDELPRSPVGKVVKRAVREHFWKGKERRV
ncbi:class I adenylate-forming enzyme family protein [Rhizobacter sp. Root404]|uniref:class I adenylate-forming enzyme family protein n=1 Tax=Rhizobacter sp. Root404 TaxID=1736528 RepID=UPI0009E68279|nr:AMP-binding protein [Rhizobacter sp. Root404]